MAITNLRAKDHRANARAALGGNLFSGNWVMGLLVCLVVALISGAAAAFVPAIGALLITGPLAFGMAACFVGACRSNEKMGFENVFSGFTKDFVQTFLIGLMTAIFTFLWSLLFVIPGIVKSYSYSMAYYVKNDHMDWDWKACIDESRRIMDGNKWKLFCLQLSFIGWAIVCGFTFGIGYLWLMPYMEAANASFYESIKD